MQEKFAQMRRSKGQVVGGGEGARVMQVKEELAGARVSV